MSIKRWKQIITITITLLFILLLILVIFLGIRLKHQNELVEDDKVIDLTAYSSLDEKELDALFKYFGTTSTTGNLEYQNLFPDLYVENDFHFVATEGKQCYLTFDDGPSLSGTAQILDILKENNVKATFFVIYDDTKEAEALYKRIVDEGHTIGIHSASHDYQLIYSSIDAYLTDFKKISSHIQDITGVKPEIFRFPGGSINTYNSGIYRELIAEMLRRGYTYYDWNVSSGDAGFSQLTKENIVSNVLSGSMNQEDAIVLMHDSFGHSTTVAALPEIIEGLKNQGYSFAPLDNSVVPWCFGY